MFPTYMITASHDSLDAYKQLCFRNAINKSIEVDRTRRISLGQIHPARINTRILTNMITQVGIVAVLNALPFALISIVCRKNVFIVRNLTVQGSGTALVAGNDEHSETFGTSGQTVVTNLESRPSINEIDEIDEMKEIAETELNSISDVDSQLKLTNLYP